MVSKHFFTCLFVVLVFDLSFAQPELQQELSRYQRDRNYDIEFLADDILKITYEPAGNTKYIDISDHQIDWLAISPEMQVFDLINADTMLYRNKYKRTKTFLIGSVFGYPMVIGDFNHNGKTDFAGTYKPQQNIEIGDAAIAEVGDDTAFTLTKFFTDSTTNALAATDLDNDGRTEINFRRLQWFYNYESPQPDSFPDSLNLTYRMWEISSAISSETFTDLDNDNFTDVLYVGDDSLPPWGQKVYVAEYNPLSNRFDLKFRYPPPNWRVSGFSTGDFDGDGYKEFVTGSIYGDVYIFENSGDDEYHLVFSDTINAPNAYMAAASNDIDGNGKKEFFVGGSAYYGGIGASKIYWFEADQDNHYRKVRSFFLLGTDVLGNAELYVYDVNHDGTDDLVFGFSSSVVILTWNQGGYFDLFYLDWWENWDQEIEGINVYDVFETGIPDLFVSVEDIVGYPRIKSYYFTNNFMSTGIHNQGDPPVAGYALSQNYPNPFNSQTNIRFYLSKAAPVELVIYDINGKEVIKLIDKKEYLPGDYREVWNGYDANRKEVSSGIYYLVLDVESQIISRKILFIK